MNVAFTNLTKIVLGGKDITAQGWTQQIGLQGEFLKVFTPEGQNKVIWNQNAEDGLNRHMTWWKSKYSKNGSVDSHQSQLLSQLPLEPVLWPWR